MVRCTGRSSTEDDDDGCQPPAVPRESRRSRNDAIPSVSRNRNEGTTCTDRALESVPDTVAPSSTTSANVTLNHHQNDWAAEKYVWRNRSRASSRGAVAVTPPSPPSRVAGYNNTSSISERQPSTGVSTESVPDTVASLPAGAAALLHEDDDVLAAKRQAAANDSGMAVAPGAVAVGSSGADPATFRSSHSLRSTQTDAGCPPLQVPNRFPEAVFLDAVTGGPRDKEEEQKLAEAESYEEKEKSSCKKKSSNFAPVVSVKSEDEDITKKKKKPQVVEHVAGPNATSSDDDMFLDSPTSMVSAELAVAAEVVADEKDIEAQVQARVHEEREEIAAQVQKRLMDQAVHADVVTAAEGFEDKSPCSKRRMILAGILAAVVVAAIVVVVVVVVFVVGKDNSSLDGSATTVPPTPPPTAETPTMPVTPDSKCTLCADASVPKALESLTLGGDGVTCANFMESQAELENSSDACVQGQAEAWRFCDCPTLPPLPENATCSLCTDVSIPLGNPERSFENKTCSAWNTFMAHVGSSESECAELQAGLKDIADFCECLSEPTFLQFLTSLLFPISGDVMLKEGTPQNDALNWLAFQDPANLTSSASTEELEQRYIIAVLYFATDGSSWEQNYTFLSINDVCSWNNGGSNGVFCTSGGVSKIELDSNNLAGTLPDEITSLTSLVTIEMSNNLLVGTMPQSIGDLMAIEGFSIYQNAMTGTLPASIFNIQTLKVLWLDKNLFSGVLPSTIGNAKALDWFSCPECSLHGTIPASIGSLGNLRILDLGKNALEGAIPTFAGNKRLEELFLNDNKLTGTLPSTLGNLARMQRIFLLNNLLTGTIPRSVGDLQSLTTISFSGNSLTGDIPPFKSELINQIFLYNNELTGTLDEFFNSSAPAALSIIRFEDNKLTGTLPQAIGNFLQLEEFFLMQNQLTGTIPSTLGNLINVRLLALNQNNLNGTLPSSLGNLSKVEFLDVDVNFLTGSLPRSIGALPSLTFFYVDQNSLTGVIPTFTSQQISDVWIFDNFLTGGLDEFFNSSSSATLKSIRLEENRLSGSLPEAVGNFLQLTEIHLSDNKLTGPIPSSLQNLVNLGTLWLNNAGITGTIPTELGSLINLEYLDLGVNDLSGTVPTELDSCVSLVSLALAICGLSGSFPTSVANLPELEDLLLHGNDFTNDFDETFCARADNIDRLIANCLDDTVVCSCCTMCCNQFGNNCIDHS